MFLKGVWVYFHESDATYWACESTDLVIFVKLPVKLYIKQVFQQVYALWKDYCQSNGVILRVLCDLLE